MCPSQIGTELKVRGDTNLSQNPDQIELATFNHPLPWSLSLHTASLYHSQGTEVPPAVSSGVGCDLVSHEREG